MYSSQCFKFEGDILHKLKNRKVEKYPAKHKKLNNAFHSEMWNEHL